MRRESSKRQEPNQLPSIRAERSKGSLYALVSFFIRLRMNPFFCLEFRIDP